MIFKSIDYSVVVLFFMFSFSSNWSFIGVLVRLDDLFFLIMRFDIFGGIGSSMISDREISCMLVSSLWELTGPISEAWTSRTTLWTWATASGILRDMLGCFSWNCNRSLFRLAVSLGQNCEEVCSSLHNGTRFGEFYKWLGHNRGFCTSWYIQQVASQAHL